MKALKEALFSRKHINSDNILELSHKRFNILETLEVEFLKFESIMKIRFMIHTDYSKVSVEYQMTFYDIKSFIDGLKKNESRTYQDRGIVLNLNSGIRGLYPEIAIADGKIQDSFRLKDIDELDRLINFLKNLIKTCL